MADKKISQLSNASTPLAGTESLPIVQSGATVKATILNVQTAPVSTGVANGMMYLNGSKVPSTSSNLTYSGTRITFGQTEIQPNYIYMSTGGTAIGFVGSSAVYYSGPVADCVFGAYNGDVILASGSTQRLRAENSGNVLVGLPSLSTSATNGFIYIPTCAGVPTGTPATRTGFAPMVVDSTNNKLYVYIGAAWQAMN